MKTIFCSLLTLFCFSSITSAQQPKLGLPIGHHDYIANLLVSNDGKYLLTGDRGSMKLWDIKTGKLLRSNNKRGATFYIQLDATAEHVLFTDGVTDVWNFVWDIEKDSLVFVEGGSSWPVQPVTDSPFRKSWTETFSQNLPEFARAPSVYFSPDDRFALVVSGDSYHYEYWDLKLKKQLNRDSALVELAPQIQPFMATFADFVFFPAIGFTSDGKPLVTYRPNPNTIEVREVLTNRVVHTISDPNDSFYNAVFTANGKELITANRYSLRHWDLPSGRLIKNFDTRARLFQEKPQMEPDEKGLRIQMKHGNCYWNFESGTLETPKSPASLPNPRLDFAWSKNIYLTTPDGLYGWDYKDDKTYQTLQLWDLTAQKIITEIPKFGFMGGDGGDYFCLSQDRKSMVISYTVTYTTLKYFTYFDLEKKQPLSAPFSSDRYGDSHVLVLSKDNTRLLCGFSNGEYPVLVFDPMSGQVVQTLRLSKGKVLNMAFSNDNRFAYVACTDLTLHVFDVASGKEIAALVAIGDHDWAVTSPDGLFDASPGAMQALFYTVGREVIELEQLKERYYEPGLLSKVMGFNQEAPRLVNDLKEVPLYPEMKTNLKADLQQLEVALTPRAGGVGKLSLFVNGKEVAEDLNPQRARKVNINLADYAKYYFETGGNTIGLRVYNSDNWLKSPSYELAYTPPPTTRGTGTGGTELTLGAKPSLYAVVVGTANYAGEKLDLKFADRDAIAFSQALRAAGKKVFNDRVNVTLLHTDAADPNRQDISSKNAIKAAFAAYAAKAKSQDILVVYFSGHGVNYGAAEQSLFYYLTKDVASEDLKDPEIRKNYAISSLEITDWVKSIAALKQVMIIDACSSGKIVEDFAGTRKDLNASQIRALDRMKDRTGMFILTGSAADKVSYEAGQYGQGLLTYSLLQGMSGLALTDDKRVDVMTLFQYARDRVPVLAKGIGGVQTPMLAFPTNGASFDIGIVDKEVKIPLPGEKPVFIRNNFTDEASFDDVIGVTDAIESYLRELTLQGAQAPIIFVDVKEYEQAYSLKGRYTLQGDQVQLSGKLYKGKTAIADIKQQGNKNDLRSLAVAILEQVAEKLK